MKINDNFKAKVKMFMLKAALTASISAWECQALPHRIFKIMTNTAIMWNKGRTSDA